MYECRNCRSRDLYEVLDLGEMPLAGDFRLPGEKNRLYPLAIDSCGQCGVLQVRELVAHSVIFHPGYSYASSTVPGLVKHFEEYARKVALPSGAAPKRLLEVGCNDGVFLEPLRRAGYSVVGIDASENVVGMARARGLDVHVGTFGKATATALEASHGRFDVVTCSNVFAHNPMVNEFVEGVKQVLAPSGEFWVEVHSVHSLHAGLQWDCFYHEHCFYWSIHALQLCLGEAGLRLRRWGTTPMHGGALRAVFSFVGEVSAPSIPEFTRADWEEFRRDCLRSRILVRDSVNSLPIRYAYGAAGRAVTLLNWTGIAPKLDFMIDGSPLRYGKLVPNTELPVISETSFFAGERETNDWCFVTAHNYLDGIREKVVAAFPGRPMKFVTPLPHVTIR